jgi:hypothetical protein
MLIADSGPGLQRATEKSEIGFNNQHSTIRIEQSAFSNQQSAFNIQQSAIPFTHPLPR